MRPDAPLLSLYDTLQRTLLPVRPADGPTYRFYCCGPTVYGPAHIGNFRTFALQDVFRRVLEMTGIPTLHVRNITDVDDKTIRDSQASGQSLRQFTQGWTGRFHEDCRLLQLLPPHQEPGAVDHIPHQIRMIETLLAKGHAYTAADGSVYYRVASFPSYGKLSHLEEQDLIPGSSVMDADEYEKVSLADFALWKARKPGDGDNFWDSPWGSGRPGWHLECSAMSREYLGDTFDLHSGGIDLCFPHHENEIAQSEAATGHTLCHHWFHLTHLMVNGGKMSKSAGNFYTLAGLQEKGFSPAELRYALIAAHYRQPLNFIARDPDGQETFPSLRAARQALRNLARAEAALRERAGASVPPAFPALRDLPHPGPFPGAWQALLHDLNTPEALGQTFSALKEPSSTDPLTAWLGLHRILWCLGLSLPTPEASPVPPEIAALALRRWEAKLARDWSTADQLRDQIATLGWTVKDSRDSYEVLPLDP